MTDAEPYLPVVNGAQVPWDEYYEKHPEMQTETRHDIVPTMIRNVSEYNMCRTKFTIASIIDLCVNEVEFAFVSPEDIKWVLEILRGYITELKPYSRYSADVDATIAKIEKVIRIIKEADDSNERFIRAKEPEKQNDGVASVMDILKLIM